MSSNHYDSLRVPDRTGGVEADDAVTAVAHPNIALVKYWGKRDESLILPVSSSLSMTLDRYPTTTSVMLTPRASIDTVTVNGYPAAGQTRERVQRFLDVVRELASRSECARVQTTNTVPTGAGLASSANGFAALAAAAAAAYGLGLDPRALSRLARRGSGSACRSIFGGFVVWHAGIGCGEAGNRSSYAEPIDAGGLDPAVVVAAVDTGPKPMSSRQAMRRTAETSPFYLPWIESSVTDLAAMRTAITRGALATAGEIAERNALGMHATMLAARPAIRYLSPLSLLVLDRVVTLRKRGVAAYATIDAGPNAVVLCARVDAPWVAETISEIVSFATIQTAFPGPGTAVPSRGGGMISHRAPGKLFIAGEYAVLETGRPAVIAAIDRYATVTVTAAGALAGTTMQSDLASGSTMCCERVGDRLRPVNCDAAVRGCFAYVMAAVVVVDRLITERGLRAHHFHLTVTSTLTDADGHKFGLGSSAAVTVATIAALDEFYELDLSLMDRYRLAMVATIAVRPRASGGDVAASTWGGWVAYSTADRHYVKMVAADCGVDACLHAHWPGLSVRGLPAPTGLQLQVGWTGEPASTATLVTDVDGARQRIEGYYLDFLARSTECVRRLVAAVEADDSATIQDAIRRARRLLADLDAVVRLGIFTPRLNAMCAIAEAVGAAAKPSGAGGGDCGIALVSRDSDAAVADLRNRWTEAEIRPLPLSIHPPEEVTT